MADSVRNVIDYLTGAELVLAPNPVAESSSRISWHAADPSVPFLDSRDHTTISQYLAWLNAGNYSCVLFDGSLLQMSYALEKGRVIGHRLAYVPCPWQFDLSLIREGLALDEVFELCSSEDVLLRSPVRFDYDPAASRLGHPAAHMTLNSSECRIACVAPLHAHRFTNFVFEHFYSDYWKSHHDFFSVASYRHIGEPVISDTDREGMHLSWNPRLRHSA
ncbi:DUF2290 domain-containing protein [Nocardia cyriacigeorgica]|uniref:DUF2290 domain-containing protein n=1 Tax=Nocardia cyriacigeorgica TaxID=135487 RepID=UPI002493B223|nr:DUF2290 domain-containing protein [Nocardia cyriacigeorgica]